MTQLEMTKKEIAAINHPSIMVGYLRGIRNLAVKYCEEHYPDEIVISDGKYDVTNIGMEKFLKSDTADSEIMIKLC